MDFTADSLVSHAAGELRSHIIGLIHDVELTLRRGVPELWDAPEIARMTSDAVADHIDAVLAGLERGVGPAGIEPPDMDLGRTRLLARHGAPVSVLLRAFRLGEGVVLDGLLRQMPGFTTDAELISAAMREALAMMTSYVECTAAQGVVAYQEEHERRVRRRLAAVSDASMRIGTTLDITRTAQELANLATEDFSDLITVDLLDSALPEGDVPVPDAVVLRRVAERSVVDRDPNLTPVRQETFTYEEGSPQASALATGQSARHHLDAGPPLHEDVGCSTDMHPVHSMLIVPLCARGSILGVAQFSRHCNPDPFDEDDLLLAHEVVARAAVAVDNASRYTSARATSLALQRSLLPQQAPEQSAVEVACRYLPAEARVGVGGDWFDVIPLSGARVALVVGDVVGHGIHAAATMGRLRTAVRTLADIDLPPDELLTHLDDVVLRLAADASMSFGEGAAGDIGATCLYAVYDPVLRSCSMARAGHVQPAMVSRDGTVEILDLPPGPPLGLGGLPFEAMELDLPEESLLALYTDGLIEARDRDVDEGLRLLRNTLAQPNASLEATCDMLLDALLPVGPGDDVALLLARTHALGGDQVATWDLDPDPSVVSWARSRVSGQLTVWGREELDFTAALVVSELVTNAIRYGRPPIRLRLIHDGTLTCEVSDAGSTTPHLRRARVFDEGGRGLLLVAQFAQRWGTRHARGGKTVWAELNETSGFSAWNFAELLDPDVDTAQR
ncbi:ATP-binding SpoIIE family protein phosphatase [Streptomyces cylindrosporus]|uniref:Serine/threonine-protein phosphatase n=1 Tax=Streptomyces cylindrosporus TaxID=2927583 RepID=A0ABS9Y0B7_9ACTN|nr:ATP-binding SpoIIE family protein phosphatase [Streptomyces cylindrosporus]MCI3270666.1 serine/threonine-protein phosphatase [Streptomyces cylindrosporus]